MSLTKKELIEKAGLNKIRITSVKPRVSFHKSTSVRPSKKRYSRKKDWTKSTNREY